MANAPSKLFRTQHSTNLLNLTVYAFLVGNKNKNKNTDFIGQVQPEAQILISYFRIYINFTNIKLH